jgi:alpha-glucosidase
VVVVSMNFTGEAKTVSLDLSAVGVSATKVKTLATDDPALKGATSLSNITLAPYASWVAVVE